MTSKVMQIRGGESTLGEVASTPNKVIGGDAMLAKLAGALNTVVGERAKNLSAIHDATEILREAAPAAFDHEAAVLAVAEARVVDLMAGTSTADAMQADFDKRRTAAEGAIANHERRLTAARQQLERASSLLEALTAQGVELDKALRREFSRFGAEKSDEVVAELSRSVARYLDDFINYRAAIWLRGIASYGGKGRQFWPAADEMDLSFAVLDEFIDLLPAGCVRSSTPGVVTYKSYVVKQLVQQRGLEMMNAKTRGLYPQVAVDLPRPQDS